MTLPPPPLGRGRHARPETGDRPIGPAGPPVPGEQPGAAATPGGPPADRRRRRGLVIDRDQAADFPVAEYARSTEPEPSGVPPTAPGSPGGPEPARAALPPRPVGAWSRLQRRTDPRAAGPDDQPTVAQPVISGPAAPPPQRGRGTRADDDLPPVDDDDPDDDRTGGLEVIVDDGPRSGRRRSGRRAAAHPDHGFGRSDGHVDGHAEGYPESSLDDHADDGPRHQDDDEDFHGSTVAAGERGRSRRRRGPFAVVSAFVVLAGLVAGIVLGGQRLIDLINPPDQDYTGSGTGSVEIRVAPGDTLSDIATTLTGADVIASSAPFVDAAAGNPAATGIQPGTYQLRAQMSGAAALDLLLDPASRLVSRVTIPEGYTAAAILSRLAEQTGVPLADFEAAAADPVALGLPAYADGQLEGFLFPATYDVEPGDSAADMLRTMVGRFSETAVDISLEQRAAAAGRSVHDVVVIASMIRSETKVDAERPDVAQVIYNRLARGTTLGIDATLAYGLGKNGNDLTRADLQSDNPYNTRINRGLPPTAISSPGQADLEAALSPSTGDLLFYVLESEDGSHFFTADPGEFAAAVQRCAAADLGCGG